MAVTRTYLEHRPTSYYWRRRVPAREVKRFKPTFFCFSLQTHVFREAADVARRITAISDICFNAETDMPPEMMTQILIDYARLDIEAADQLRARTGARTREAAEIALAVEAAARASLRDSIFLCDMSPTLSPIRDTAARLGIALDETEEDFALLTGKMIPLLIELSEEKERRAKGIFLETQPYLSAALLENQASGPAPQVSRSTVSAPQPPIAHQTKGPTAESSAVKDTIETTAPIAETSAVEPDKAFHTDGGLTVTVNTAHGVPARLLDGSEPTILELWDAWFDEMSRGVYREGAYSFEDEGKAKRFLKEADTIRSTRKLINDILGNIKVSQATGADWSRYNDTLRKLPSNHGKSSKLEHLTCLEFIQLEDKKERERLDAANTLIARKHLEGDEKEKLLRNAKTKRISPRTFQRHQKHLSGPFDHAVMLGKLSHNPFKPFVVGESTIDDMRKSLPDTTRQIWTSKEFATLLRTKQWNAGKVEMDDPIYWIPLIAFLHGLRSEEILQLTPKDIRCDDGIHFFDILKGTGKSLKSNNARRMVPIHSQLIELGFLELVERQRKLSKSRIFDKVARSKSKKANFTANFTKKFTYYRKRCKVYHAQQDLHSMRASFNSKLVGGSTPDTARRYLMGHKNDDVGITNYLPDGFSLKALKNHVETRQIDLTVITKRFNTAVADRKGLYLIVDQGVNASVIKSA